MSGTFRQDQLIYLSNFVLDKFEQLHKLTGDTRWVFPAKYKPGHVCIKSATKQIGDRHVINLCQNHVIGTKLNRVYLLDEYADDKRDAWYKLGDKLDEILFSGNAT